MSRLMKRLLVMNLLTVAASQSQKRELNLLDGLLEDATEESGVSVAEGSDGFPGVRFASHADVAKPLPADLRRGFFPSFSLRADFKLDSPSTGGFLFAIVDPALQVVSVGLEARGAGHNETEVCLHLTEASSGDPVVSTFLVPVAGGRWTHLSLSVLEDAVSLYVDCRLSETVSLPPWDARLAPDSLLRLATAGPSSHTRLQGIVERLKLYEDADLAPATCTTSFKGFSEDAESASVNLEDLFSDLPERKASAVDQDVASTLSQEEGEGEEGGEMMTSTTLQPHRAGGEEVTSHPPDCHGSPTHPADCHGPPTEKASCLPGEPGAPGQVGEKGDKGDKGDRGAGGVDGSPGRVTDEHVERVLASSLHKGRLTTLKGEPGSQGPPGQNGPPGPQGERGRKGEAGSNGEKGGGGDRGLPGLKGDKGRRGRHGPPGVCKPSPPLPPVKGEKGDRGSEGKLLFVSGPPGRPGVSIVGEKGEPGQSCLCAAATPSVRQGRLARPEHFYSGQPDPHLTVVPGALTFPDLDSMLQMTQVTSEGTMAYVVSQEALAVRMKRGWHYVSVGGAVDAAVRRGTDSDGERRGSPEVSPPRGAVRRVGSGGERGGSPEVSPPHPTPHSLLPHRPSLMLVGLNEAETGDMGGQRGADLACYRQSKLAALSTTFRAFLATSIQNLNSLVRHSDTTAPVVNIKGELLLDSWQEIFSVGGLAALKEGSAIYRFDGRKLTSHHSRDEKYVWYGGSREGELLAEAQCDGWTSDSPHHRATAYNLLTGTLHHLPCSHRLAVLCVEVSASKQTRRSPAHHSHRPLPVS